MNLNFENLNLPTLPNPENDPRVNPAKWAYERLQVHIQRAESELDSDHEVRVTIPVAGQMMQIGEIGYHGPDFVIFYGGLSGEQTTVIQNIAQLNVVLTTTKKIEEKARRIGFVSESE